MSVPVSSPTGARAATTMAEDREHRVADRGSRPLVRLVRIWLVAYVTLTAVCIALGVFLTQASATAGVRRWDVAVNRWFAHRRTGALNAWTAVGSHLAETPTVVGAGLVLVALLWWRRRDLYAIGLLVVGLTLEVMVFVTTTLFVDRGRPPVHHLDAAPPTSSFPSGHTAAAIVLYVGLIVVVHHLWHRNALTIATGAVLVLFPVAVALSRLYRGMHHPTDVLVGVALGAVALAIAVTSVRSTIVRSGRGDPLTRREEVA